MNALNMINPKGIFNKLVETFGARKITIALGVGGSLAIAGMTTVFIVYPDDPKPIETKTVTEAAKTAVETVTENIIEKENV